MYFPKIAPPPPPPCVNFPDSNVFYQHVCPSQPRISPPYRCRGLLWTQDSPASLVSLAPTICWKHHGFFICSGGSNPVFFVFSGRAIHRSDPCFGWSHRDARRFPRGVRVGCGSEPKQLAAEGRFWVVALTWTTWSLGSPKIDRSWAHV